MMKKEIGLEFYLCNECKNCNHLDVCGGVLSKQQTGCDKFSPSKKAKEEAMEKFYQMKRWRKIGRKLDKKNKNARIKRIFKR